MKLEKLGKLTTIYGYLKSEGWKGSYFALAMQKKRGRLTADVIQKLWSYCEKHGIKVKPEDFKEGT